MASIYLGCRLNTLDAVFAYTPFTRATPLPEFQSQPLHQSKEEWEEALQIGIFFIVLYYCEV